MFIVVTTFSKLFYLINFIVSQNVCNFTLDIANSDLNIYSALKQHIANFSPLLTLYSEARSHIGAQG
jgi:hypothetical protein